VRGYTNWVNDLGQSLLKDLSLSLTDAISEIRDINLAIPEDIPKLLLTSYGKMQTGIC
jgi:hypothetical protein